MFLNYFCHSILPYFKVGRAHSPAVECIHGMDEARVRLPMGPFQILELIIFMFISLSDELLINL